MVKIKLLKNIVLTSGKEIIVPKELADFLLSKEAVEIIPEKEDKNVKKAILPKQGLETR